MELCTDCKSLNRHFNGINYDIILFDFALAVFHPQKFVLSNVVELLHAVSGKDLKCETKHSDYLIQFTWDIRIIKGINNIPTDMSCSMEHQTFFIIKDKLRLFPLKE